MASGGLGLAVMAGIGGGVVGHKVGKKNEKDVKNRIQKVKFHSPEGDQYT